MPIIFKKVGSTVAESDDSFDENAACEGQNGGERREQQIEQWRGDDMPIAQDDDDCDEDNVRPSLDENNFNDEEQDVSMLERVRDTFPRLYYVTTQLILPLLTLIGMAFLFGWLLAKFEMEGEIQRNNEVLAETFHEYLMFRGERMDIWDTMRNTSATCFADAVNTTLLHQTFPNEFTNMVRQVQECSFGKGQRSFPMMELDAFLVYTLPSLTFDWMTCWEPFRNLTDAEMEKRLVGFGMNPEDSHDQQLLRYMLQYGDLLEKNIQAQPNNTPFETRIANGIAEATGSKGCEIHVAGGALFWFTIMTTIGYGNTAPTTDEGRLLVFTAGFFTIICFLALNNTAAKVWKYLFEDLFLSCNLKCLVKGPLSVLFWLCMTILWMLVIALSLQSYRKNRVGEDFPLKDAFWFSYITTTTVGFGDIHVSHEEFTVGDMFFVPLIVLMGFNFLGIFAEKGVDLYNHYFPEECGLKDALHDRRHGKKRQVATVDIGGWGVETVEEC